MTGFHQVKPLHESTSFVRPLFPKTLLAMRARDKIPEMMLDQKSIKPALGFEKTPTPSSRAFAMTKIEIPNQKAPLMRSCRFTWLVTCHQI